MIVNYCRHPQPCYSHPLSHILAHHRLNTETCYCRTDVFQMSKTLVRDGTAIYQTQSIELNADWKLYGLGIQPSTVKSRCFSFKMLQISQVAVLFVVVGVCGHDVKGLQHPEKNRASSSATRNSRGRRQ